MRLGNPKAAGSAYARSIYTRGAVGMAAIAVIFLMGLHVQAKPADSSATGDVRPDSAALALGVIEVGGEPLSPLDIVNARQLAMPFAPPLSDTLGVHTLAKLDDALFGPDTVKNLRALPPVDDLLRAFKVGAKEGENGGKR